MKMSFFNYKCHKWINAVIAICGHVAITQYDISVHDRHTFYLSWTVQNHVSKYASYKLFSIAADKKTERETTYISEEKQNNC